MERGSTSSVFLFAEYIRKWTTAITAIGQSSGFAAIEPLALSERKELLKYHQNQHRNLVATKSPSNDAQITRNCVNSTFLSSTSDCNTPEADNKYMNESSDFNASTTSTFLLLLSTVYQMPTLHTREGMTNT
jgi:hypothetical protein